MKFFSNYFHSGEVLLDNLLNKHNKLRLILFLSKMLRNSNCYFYVILFLRNFNQTLIFNVCVKLICLLSLLFVYYKYKHNILNKNLNLANKSCHSNWAQVTRSAI